MSVLHKDATADNFMNIVLFNYTLMVHHTVFIALKADACTAGGKRAHVHQKPGVHQRAQLVTRKVEKQNVKIH